MDEARIVKDPGRLAFWADRVRAFTETNTLTWEVAPSAVIRRSRLRRRFYIDPHGDPTTHVEYLRAAVPDDRHAWENSDPLTPFEDLWPTFQELATASDEDAFAVIDLPCKRVQPDTEWEWTEDDLEVREFGASTTWNDVLDSCTDTEQIFGPFFKIDRLMVVGSSGSWCLIYTEIPDVESWVTTSDHHSGLVAQLMKVMSRPAGDVR